MTATMPARPPHHESVRIMNLFGRAMLLLMFWFVTPRLGNGAWVVDALFILYVAMIFGAWLSIGCPNPRGLGCFSRRRARLGRSCLWPSPCAPATLCSGYFEPSLAMAAVQPAISASDIGFSGSSRASRNEP